MKLLRALSPEEVGNLRTLSEDPNLTIDGANHGYRYYGVDKEENAETVTRMNALLRDSVDGGPTFCNFTPDGRVRFTYNYNYDNSGVPFQGVGYLGLGELARGCFTPEEE